MEPLGCIVPALHIFLSQNKIFFKQGAVYFVKGISLYIPIECLKLPVLKLVPVSADLQPTPGFI
jgi:hypothetical protein